MQIVIGGFPHRLKILKLFVVLGVYLDMTGVDRANGHKPAGISPLHHPALTDAPRPDADKLDYDLNEALSAVVPLQARAPEDAFSASYPGTEREGNAVLISEDACS